MKIGKRFCPECESEDVEMVAGGVTGMWLCRECGNSGMFPEKHEPGKEDDEFEEIEKVEDEEYEISPGKTITMSP